MMGEGATVQWLSQTGFGGKPVRPASIATLMKREADRPSWPKFARKVKRPRRCDDTLAG